MNNHGWENFLNNNVLFNILLNSHGGRTYRSFEWLFIAGMRIVYILNDSLLFLSLSDLYVFNNKCLLKKRKKNAPFHTIYFGWRLCRFLCKFIVCNGKWLFLNAKLCIKLIRLKWDLTKMRIDVSFKYYLIAGDKFID